MQIIGLTGGIASGKSTVSAYLKDKGVRIIDADQIAREVVLPGKPALQQVVEAFGEEVIYGDGTLNRKALAQKVFKDPEALKRLNGMIHPPILAQIKAQLIPQTPEEKVVVLDAALLIELGLTAWVHEVWLVCISEAIQVQRLCQREHMTPEDAYKIIRSQMTEREKQPYATHCIDNNGSLEDLYQQLDALWHQKEC